MKAVKQRNEERVSVILDLYEQGFSLEEIGKKYHITRERVRQIIERAWLEEIDQRTTEGFVIDVSAFVESRKNIHNMAHKKKKYTELLKKRDELPAIVEKYTSAKSFYKDYAVDRATVREFFPKIFEKLERLENERKNRWCKNYTNCRLCGTTDRKHHQKGYCKKCFRDAKVFGGNREIAFIKAKQCCESCGIKRSVYKNKAKQDLFVFHKRNKTDHSLDNLEVLCYPCLAKKVQHPKRKMRESP